MLKTNIQRALSLIALTQLLPNYFGEQDGTGNLCMICRKDNLMDVEYEIKL